MRGQVRPHQGLNAGAVLPVLRVQAGVAFAVSIV